MRMPFGKYRGYDVSDIPDSYLEWLIDNDILCDGRLFGAVIHETVRREKSTHYSAPPPASKLAIPAHYKPMVKEIIRTGYRASPPKNFIPIRAALTTNSSGCMTPTSC
jgi:hypothetical protein